MFLIEFVLGLTMWQIITGIMFVCMVVLFFQKRYYKNKSNNLKIDIKDTTKDKIFLEVFIKAVGVKDTLESIKAWANEVKKVDDFEPSLLEGMIKALVKGADEMPKIEVQSLNNSSLEINE